MSSSLKTLALRLPRNAPSQSPTVMRRSCSQASMSTAAVAAAAAAAAAACPTKASSSLCHKQSSKTPSSLLRHYSNGAAASSSSSSSSSKAAIRLIPARAPSTIASQARCFASSAGAPAPPASSAPAPVSAGSTLDWNTFFKLRLRRRRIQLLFSVSSGLLGGAGGAILLSTGMAEPLVMQIPLDPFVTLGLMTLACAGMGWLAGPSIGNQVFYLMNHRLKSQMMQKESEFFTRVKKHRVDPTNSSAGNPVPDFYGEKIQSVLGYRQWLKDQRAFNKKKTRAFV